MNFTLDASVLTFSMGGSYDVGRPHNLGQVTERKADGTLEVEQVGSAIIRRELTFDALPKTDHDALKTWYTTTANGAVNEFTFTDEAGDSGTVIITDVEWNFREIDWQTYSGTLTLEYV